MASPCGSTVFPISHIEAILTVTPSKMTDPRRTRQVSAMDGSVVSGIFRSSLHVVLYYKSVSEEDSGWLLAGWAMESLARALSEQQPLLAGRLRRGEDGDGELEIVSNDSGVRLIEARIAVTLSSFLELLKENEEAEAQLICWPDIDEQSPHFSPLFYVQVTNFQCGGYSIGISCSFLVADLLVKENFLNSWAIIHNNILSSNNGPQKPLFYLPTLKYKGSSQSPTSIISPNPRKNCGQTMHFKVTAVNANLDSEMCKALALLCIEEAESRLGSKMDSELCLFVKEKCEVIKVHKCSKNGFVKPQLSLENRVTSAGWDDLILGANDVAFREGNKPVHVSYWIGSVSDGLVMAIPSSPSEDAPGMNILVTIPNKKED